MINCLGFINYMKIEFIAILNILIKKINTYSFIKLTDYYLHTKND